MTSLARILKPSWWAYHWQYRNPLHFWWQYLNTRRFPDDINSIDDLVAYGKQHNILGFNRECIRAYIIWKLHQHFGCSAFVETGTLYGSTAAYVQRVFKTPVFTSEINPTYSLVSKINLLWASGIRKFLSNSPDFLRRVCEPSAIGDRPMFYLDAHWYDYLPLTDELDTIGKQCPKGIIVIDDFFNPRHPGFQYDTYGDIRIDADFVNNNLGTSRDDFFVYYPSYSPDQDPTGKGIGFGVVLMGLGDLPPKTFPFELLMKAQW